jgi:hypothetical protein
LIVCLLALFCLQITFADRLNTRIASPFVATPGQFPFIASITYPYVDAANAPQVYSATGIIYSSTSIVTTANVFTNFPAAGAQVTIAVGAADLGQSTQVLTFPATKGLYAVVPDGTTPPPPPTDLILVPTQFVAGGSAFDIATIKLPAGSTFTASPEIKVGNFPTSSPLPNENLYAVAYGNQNPGGPVFPKLKFTRMFLKKGNKCQKALAGSNITRPFTFTSNFCVQSQKAVDSPGGTFGGVCARDIGGALIRTGDITNPADYYEVLGLISWSNDLNTCNAANPTPAIIVYLSVYTNNFIVPILGSLQAAGNGQNPALNPNSGKGNFICGNNKIDTPYEKCDDNTNRCCNIWTCAFRFSGVYCGTTKPFNSTKPNKCQTRQICDNDGLCAVRPKKEGLPCAKGGKKCVSGVCT